MEIKKQIKKLIIEILKKEKLVIHSFDFNVEHPEDLKNGDYFSNVAMVYFGSLSRSQNLLYNTEIKDKKLSKSHVGNFDISIGGHFFKNPKDLAEKITKELLIKLSARQDLAEMIDKVEVAGPGFINFYLSRKFFSDSIKEILKQKENWGKNNLLAGKKVMVEYTDPNPFKPFHIGHLMTNAIGESIARLLAYSGAHVIHVNYQGDVGPHVAKAVYGIINNKLGVDLSASSSVNAKYIGECYAKGSHAYDSDENIKKEIDEINKKIYDRSDEEVNKVYDWGRHVTLDAFEEIYKLLGTKFDHYFFESDMAPVGMKIVKDNTPKIFQESEGAVVFKADDYDPKLHTRVFITSQDIPLYETKEIGLTVTKFDKEENLDLSIVVTAIEQGEYMKVVAKAISIIYPDLEKKMKHVTHGMMRFASGKMSSRKGNVITGESMIEDSMELVREKVESRELTTDEKQNIARIVGIGALKYSILKPSLGSDIIYDQEKSISFEGDSGPYLQYSAVRANSIIKKAQDLNIKIDFDIIDDEVAIIERVLYCFPEVVSRAYTELAPHHITTYLTELSSAFNSFYADTVVLDKENKRSPYRVALVKAFYQTMKNGLYLLGIETPERM